MQSRERDFSLVKIDYLLPVNARGTQPVRMCFQDSEAALRNHGALPLSHIRLLLMNLNLKQKRLSADTISVSCIYFEILLHEFNKQPFNA